MKEKRKGNLPWSDNMANLMDYVCSSNTYLTPQWVPFVEQELPTVPEDLSYPVLLCVGFVLLNLQFTVQSFVDHCLSFFLLVIALSVVFYLRRLITLWYLQTVLI